MWPKRQEIWLIERKCCIYRCTQHILFSYIVSNMGKDHSDRKPTTTTTWDYSFWLVAKDFYMHHPRLDSAHQSWSTGWNEKYLNGFTMKDRSEDPSHHEWPLLPQGYISLWLEREISQWVHHEGLIIRPIAPCSTALTTDLHLAMPWRIDPTTHRSTSDRSYHRSTSRSLWLSECPSLLNGVWACTTLG